MGDTGSIQRGVAERHSLVERVRLGEQETDPSNGEISSTAWPSGHAVSAIDGCTLLKSTESAPLELIGPPVRPLPALICVTVPLPERRACRHARLSHGGDRVAPLQPWERVRTSDVETLPGRRARKEEDLSRPAVDSSPSAPLRRPPPPA